MTQLSTAEANRINRANRVNYETKLGTRLRALEGGSPVEATDIEDKAVGFPALADTERDEKIRLRLPGGDTADTDWEIVIGTPDHAGTVKSIKLISNTTFGKDTDYSTLTVYNREDDDTGTASVGANAFDAAGAATARVAKALTLSGTPANLTVGATDVLTLKKTHTGDGQSVPSGVLELVYTRTA